MVRLFPPSFFLLPMGGFFFSHSFGANLVEAFRAKNAVPETAAATPVSITQSLSALRLEHAHLLEEHGADRAVLRQREAELAEVQTREVDARATADALLQATRAAEERATRAERTAALAEREVGFLKALNVCFVVSFPSGMLIHLPRIGELRQRRSCSGLWQHGPCQRATHQRTREFGGRVQGANTRARNGNSRTCQATRAQPGLRPPSFA